MNICKVVEANFHGSELTIWLKFMALKKNRNFIKTMKTDDIVVFVSRRGNQLLFIHGIDGIRLEDNDVDLLASMRYRLIRGTWSPKLLMSYATAVGLPITGVEEYNRIYAEK